MKTTIELPDATLRRARTLAVSRGVTMKRLFTEALEEHLRRNTRESRVGDNDAPWMAGFGALCDLAEENRHVLAVIEQEFETVSPEDLA